MKMPVVIVVVVAVVRAYKTVQRWKRESVESRVARDNIH